VTDDAVGTERRSPAGLSADAAPDEWLVESAQGGDVAAVRELFRRYADFARAKARPYFFAGADAEDVVQEGLIGLYKAIRDFDPGRGTPFHGFADVCVTRQILTAVKSSSRYKHAPLNGYLSLNGPVADGSAAQVADVLTGGARDDPAELVISAERIRELQRHVDATLSDLEVEVLRRYVDGESYTEIARAVQRHVKAVDNALQRVKRKIGSHLRARELAEAG
jgi:RNA polymerase sporulation-specific sigma factor